MLEFQTSEPNPSRLDSELARQMTAVQRLF